MRSNWINFAHQVTFLSPCVFSNFMDSICSGQVAQLIARVLDTHIKFCNSIVSAIE